jgi:hypothetical protein
MGKSYYYSIAELVSIYLCTTKYLLHFTGDSIPMRNTQFHWLLLLIQKLESNPQISVANLLWNRKIKEAIDESIEYDSQFCIGYGFSDQMYLIRTEEFRRPFIMSITKNLVTTQIMVESFLKKGFTLGCLITTDIVQPIWV